MTALAANRDTLEKQNAAAQLVGDFGSATPNASAVFYKGALVVYDTADDTIKPGATGTGLIALGRCEDAGAAGELSSVRVRSGTYKFANSGGGDAVANSDAGSACYIVDDQTVMITATGKSAAGTVVSVDSDGVWVSINPLV
jgi:hypothetical protein